MSVPFDQRQRAAAMLALERERRSRLQQQPQGEFPTFGGALSRIGNALIPQNIRQAAELNQSITGEPVSESFRKGLSEQLGGGALARTTANLAAMPTQLLNIPQQLEQRPLETLGAFAQGIGEHAAQTGAFIARRTPQTRVPMLIAKAVGFPQAEETAAKLEQQRYETYREHPEQMGFDIMGGVGLAQGVPSMLSRFSRAGKATAVPKIIQEAVQPEIPREVIKPNTITGGVKTLTPEEVTAAQARLRAIRAAREAEPPAITERPPTPAAKIATEPNPAAKQPDAAVRPAQSIKTKSDIVQPNDMANNELSRNSISGNETDFVTKQPWEIRKDEYYNFVRRDTDDLYQGYENTRQSVSKISERIRLEELKLRTLNGDAEAKQLLKIKKLKDEMANKESLNRTADETLKASLLERMSSNDDFINKGIYFRKGDQFYSSNHRDLVSQALKDGKPVPPEVLADYPELAAKYAKPTAAPTVAPKGESAELGALGTPSAIRQFASGTSELNKWWEGVVDKGKAQIGKIIPEPIKRALDPMHNRSQAWMNAKDDYRFAKLQGIEETSQIAREAKQVIKKDRFEQAYDYLDPTERGVQRPTDLTPDETAAIDAMRDRLYSMGEEAVGVGLLDAETFTKNADTYLKRTYLKYELPNSKLARLYKQFRIKNTKGRVLETAEERTASGIIRDPIYSFAKGTAQLRHDIETAKLFKKVAEAPEFKNSIGDEWRQGLAPKPIPKRPEFGALQGKYVEQGIYDDLMEMQKWWDKGTAGRLYDKTLGAWKFGKTVMNPGTWARNGWSSGIQADVIGGLSPARLDVYAQAAREMANKTGDFAELAQAGKLRRSTYKADIEEFASFLDRGNNVSIFERILDYNSASRRIGDAADKLGGYYGGMEDFFKIAVYKYNKSIGRTPEEALKIAEDAIPDYRVSTPFVNKVARFAVPFIKYPYKILPAVADAAVKHPLRFGKYPALIYMMNQYAKDQLGLSDEEYDKLAKTKKFSGSSSMLLPTTDKNGNPLVMDLTYNLPWGDALEHGSGFAGAAGLTESFNWKGRILSMMNPLIKTPAELFAFNKSTFTGREITNSRVDTGAEAFAKMMKHAYQQMAPPLAPGNYAWNEASRVATGKKSYTGEKPSATAVVAKNLLGLKTSPINVTQETRMEKIDITKNIDAIRKEVVRVAYDQSLSDEERQRRIKELVARFTQQARNLGEQ